jgi:hypothetical protein
VVLHSEVMHETRIVRIKGTHHMPAHVGEWLGDSVGHWEDNTLVVDTTNFNGKLHFRGSSERMHVVERFTRIDRGTLQYSATVEDPDTWTTSWKIEYPFRAIDHPVVEFACHEANYSLENSLRGHRAEERQNADSFDGWWRLDEKASTGVPPMMRDHDTVVHLTQTANRFTIEFVFDGQSMNTSDFVLDGQTHTGQLGATQDARWTRPSHVIEINIHRPASAAMPAGDEHLVWELEPGGQTIRRTSTRADATTPQIYIYRRLRTQPRY